MRRLHHDPLFPRARSEGYQRLSEGLRQRASFPAPLAPCPGPIPWPYTLALYLGPIPWPYTLVLHPGADAEPR
jgi:hypothetical protein